MDVLLLRQWHPMLAGASMWAPLLSCFGYDSKMMQCLPLTWIHSPSCSGVDIIQKTVHGKNWPVLSTCTPTSYAKLLGMPFLPLLGSNTLWIIFSHSWTLNSLGLSPRMDFLWHLELSNLATPLRTVRHNIWSLGLLLPFQSTWMSALLCPPYGFRTKLTGREKKKRKRERKG